MNAETQTDVARLPSTDNKETLSPETLAVIDHRADRLAKVFHLSEEDLEDVRQELTLAVLGARRRHDPSMTAERTFDERVVSKQYMKLALRIKRDRDREPEPNTRAIENAVDPATERVGVEDERLDLQDALACLPRELRIIAEELKSKKPGEIAAAMGVHRSTIHRSIAQIRAHLAERGVGVFED